MLESGRISRAELDQVIADTQAELEEAVEFARSSPLPNPDQAGADVYA
jgi:TPP-dependent pyruvate/acetoin dehydrogenase alpha subunit